MTRLVLELYTKNRRPIVRTAVWALVQRLNMAYDGENPCTQLSILPLPKIVPGHREPVSLKRGDDSFNLLKALRVIQAVIV